MVAWNLLTKYTTILGLSRRNTVFVHDAASRKGILKCSTRISRLHAQAFKKFKVNGATNRFMAGAYYSYDGSKIGFTLGWEENGNPAVETLDNFIDFLQSRMLERIEARSKQKDVTKGNKSDKQHPKHRNQSKSTQGDKTSALAISIDNSKCYLCQGGHFLYHCDKFFTMPVN